jgi:cytochrome c-type biogenesis protein CcmE
MALGKNIDLYYTPQQALTAKLTQNQLFRLGGMVRKGSVSHTPQSLAVTFVLTDFMANIKVTYNGVLPSLFREGQGIIARGHFDKHGVFMAEEVLAKHDENYKPPEIH